MILHRYGSKAVMVKQQGLLDFFPKHDAYIELFFGAGGVFFNKPKARHNILNDLDSDVFNLFTVMMDRPGELYDVLELMPTSQDLFKYWEKNPVADPIMKAARFLMLSNCGYKGKHETMKIEASKPLKNIRRKFNATLVKIQDCTFTNKDFRGALGQISFNSKCKREAAFVYADPPYLGTTNNYEKGLSFTEIDTSDLFDVLMDSGLRFAISEFNNPFVIGLAEHNRLNVHHFGERHSIAKKANEILITNYPANKQGSMF